MVLQGARASATTELTMRARNIPVSASDIFTTMKSYDRHNDGDESPVIRLFVPQFLG